MGAEAVPQSGWFQHPANMTEDVADTFHTDQATGSSRGSLLNLQGTYASAGTSCSPPDIREPNALQNTVKDSTTALMHNSFRDMAKAGPSFEAINACAKSECCHDLG